MREGPNGLAVNAPASLRLAAVACVGLRLVATVHPAIGGVILHDAPNEMQGFKPFRTW